ncbi:unnamed protein product, partial [Staurois parvus]
MGPCTASSCCCQVATVCHVPWVPVRPPIAIHATLCHVPGLLTLLVCSIFCHRVLADYGPPIAAARPLICHGPLYRLLMLLPGPVSHGSLYGLLLLLLSPSPHSAMCHFQVSSHCWCVPFFVIGC